MEYFQPNNLSVYLRQVIRTVFQFQVLLRLYKPAEENTTIRPG